MSASILDTSADTRQSSYVRAALEANIVQLKGRVRELTDDVEQLRSHKGKITKETQDFIQYATEQLRQKDDIIKELGARLRETEYVKDAEIRRLKQQMETALDSALSDQRATEAELRERLRQSEIKLERAQGFLEMREKLETEIAALQHELSAQKSVYDTAIAELERKYLIDKAALAKAQDAKVVELRRQAREEAQRALDADTTRVIIENKKMGEELALHAEETKILAKERLAMAEQARMLAREVEIYADKEKEWARQGVRKTQENRALSAKIAELEKELAAERRERAAEKHKMTKSFEKQTEDMRLELEGLMSLLTLRNRELRTVKKLAGIILQQRTDVEQFFLDALAEVKLEVAKRKRSNAAAAADASRTALDRAGIRASFVPGKTGKTARSGATLSGAAITMMVPPLAPDATAKLARTSFAQLARDANAPKAPSALPSPSPTASEEAPVTASMPLPHVDLADLTPEDRERVLRILFARIHHAAARPARRTATGISPMAGDGDLEPSALSGPFGLSADIPDSLQQLEISQTQAPKAAPASTDPGPGAAAGTILGGPGESFGAVSSLQSSIDTSDIDTADLAEALVAKVRDRQVLEEGFARSSRPNSGAHRA